MTWHPHLLTPLPVLHADFNTRGFSCDSSLELTTSNSVNQTMTQLKSTAQNLPVHISISPITINALCFTFLNLKLKSLFNIDLLVNFIVVR